MDLNEGWWGGGCEGQQASASQGQVWSRVL